MRLLVFGSSGGTGRHLVEQALEQGHAVTAFVRDPAKLGLAHPSLTLARGDVMDYPSVERAVPGHDAVLCAIGGPAGKGDTIRSDGTRNIIRAMEAAGVRRFVCQTSLGYGDSRAALNRTPWHFRYIIVPLLLRGVFADHERQEEHVKRSALDWIIVRPGILTNGSRTGAYRHGFAATDRTIKARLSRADAADFMLKQLSDDSYLRQTPGVSY